MTSRPYMQASFYSLKALAKEHWHSYDELSAVLEELEHRSTPYAVALRNEVRTRTEELRKYATAQDLESRAASLQEGKVQDIPQNLQAAVRIEGISVQGFKSILHPVSVQFRPLTLLAGANSSGKSSVLQPVLMLKQTLEATFDPGGLLLMGPNARFTAVDQFFARTPDDAYVNRFSVGLRLTNESTLLTEFAQVVDHGVCPVRMKITNREGGVQQDLDLEGTPDKVRARIPYELQSVVAGLYGRNTPGNWRIAQARCFLSYSYGPSVDQGSDESMATIAELIQPSEVRAAKESLRRLIHVPGVRATPERAYPATAPGDFYPGTFDPYVAGIVYRWQRRVDARLIVLTEHLRLLGLTSRLEARQVNDAQVALYIGRGSSKDVTRNTDLVSIADVGFGVSQVLPVLVSLLAAEVGQVVYIEQPELHLHPRAQVALASIVAAAALRGVKVVIETHSSLLLLAVQTLVAEGKLPAALVALHWFALDEAGASNVTSAVVDETGAFGSWPEDFGQVLLKAERDYLSAAEARLLRASE